jgi:hypothetical protein
VEAGGKAVPPAGVPESLQQPGGAPPGSRLRFRAGPPAGRARADLTPEAVADVLWLAQDVHNYAWLVRRRGWTSARFQEWFVDSVAAVIFG